MSLVAGVAEKKTAKKSGAGIHYIVFKEDAKHGEKTVNEWDMVAGFFYGTDKANASPAEIASAILNTIKHAPRELAAAFEAARAAKSKAAK